MKILLLWTFQARFSPLPFSLRRRFRDGDRGSERKNLRPRSSFPITKNVLLLEKPILTDSWVHGVKLKPHLGYPRVQIEAYKKLVATIAKVYNIPLITPTINNGLMKGVHDGAAQGKFNGVVCHYHLTRRKIDCAGLKLKEIIL